MALTSAARTISFRGRALRIVTATMFHRDEPVPLDRLDFVERELQLTLESAGPRARLLFLMCLYGVMLLAPLWVLRWPTLERLPLALRLRALSRMEDSAIGAPLILAVKAALCIFYYEQPAAAHEIGHRPACLVSLPVVQTAERP